MSDSNSSSSSSSFEPDAEHNGEHAHDVESVQGLLRTLMQDADLASRSPGDAARVENEAAQYVLQQLRSHLEGAGPTRIRGLSGNVIELIVGNSSGSSSSSDPDEDHEVDEDVDEVDEVDDDMDDDAEDDAVDGDVVHEAILADAWETDQDDDSDWFPPLTEEQLEEDLEELVEDDQDGFFHRTMDERWDYIDNNVRIPSSSLVRHPQQQGVQIRYGGDFGSVRVLPLDSWYRAECKGGMGGGALLGEDGIENKD